MSVLFVVLLAFTRFVPPKPIGIVADGTEHRIHTPFEFPAEDEQWLHIVTPRFEIVSSAGDRRTRELGRDLETLAAAIPLAGATAPAKRNVIPSVSEGPGCAGGGTNVQFSHHTTTRSLAPLGMTGDADVCAGNAPRRVCA